MTFVELTRRVEIEPFLRRSPALYLYQLGDLDPALWPATRWYAAMAGGEPQAMLMLYTAGDLPVLLAFTEDLPAATALLGWAAPRLPGKVYAHVSPDLIPAIASHYRVDDHGELRRMILAAPEVLADAPPDPPSLVALTAADEHSLQEFYAEAYPGNWFAPGMLVHGVYVGIRAKGRLVAVAGTHIYSPELGVAALGNVATHPDCRGKGHATAAVAALCRRLLPVTPLIGLNVNEKNPAAHRCYESSGFRTAGTFHELTAVSSSLPARP